MAWFLHGDFASVEAWFEEGLRDQIREETVIAHVLRLLARCGTIKITVRNVGPASIDAGATDVFVNGLQVTVGLGGTCTGLTLNPGDSCVSTNMVVPSPPTIVPGAAYPLKLLTPTGGVFSYSVIAGGSS